MTLTLAAVLSAGYLEVAAHTGDTREAPVLALGEVEALVAFCRLEVVRHLNQRNAANSHEGKLALEGSEIDLLEAMQSIGSAISAIERDLAWWDGERAA